MYILLVELPYEGYYLKTFKDEKIARHEYDKELSKTGDDNYNMGCALIEGAVLQSAGSATNDLKEYRG